MCLIPAASYAVGWSPVRIEGKVIEGWYQNTSNGNYQSWSNEGFLREYTPKEFETYTKELEGYGGFSGENSTSTNDMVKTVMKDTPGMNEANAEDTVKAMENAREAPPDAFKGPPNPGELGENTIEGLDGVGQEAGTLELGAGEGVSAFLAPVTLGASAFVVGALIGNGLDELLGLPSAAKFFESEQKPIAGHEVVIRYLHEECNGTNCEKVSGYFKQCVGWGFYSEILHYSAYGEHPAEEVHYGCPGEGKVQVSRPITIKEPPEPGELTSDINTYKEVCLGPETETPFIHNCTRAPEPLTVPKPGPLTVKTEEENSADNLELAPRPELAPEVDTKPDTQTQHLPKRAPYELLNPSKTTPGWDEGDTEPATKTPTETELEKEVGKSPDTRGDPVPEYLEKPENKPYQKEAEEEPEPEAEAPGAVGPPSLPGIKTPGFGVLCKGFPFGVPCWLIKTIESWSASGSCPSLGTEEFSIKGHKIHEANVSLCPLEPIMEKVRPAMLIFSMIGVVILFYRFSRGGSPPSGGGTDDTGGDE